MARTAHDAATALSVLAGPDAYDSTASQEPVADYVGALTGEIRGLKLGVPRKMLEQGVETSVCGCFYGALDILRERGAELIDIAAACAIRDRNLLRRGPQRALTLRDTTASATASVRKARAI